MRYNTNRAQYVRSKPKSGLTSKVTGLRDIVEAKPLYLVMQKKWFDEILSGRKTIEYRDDTPFYRSRLTKDGQFRNYNHVIMQVGYHAEAQRMTVEIEKVILADCFEIHLGKIIEQNF